MNTITGFTFYDSLNKLTVGTLLLLLVGGMIGEKAETNILFFVSAFIIGIFYQTFIKYITRFLTNNLHMIKKAHENVILKNKYIYIKMVFRKFLITKMIIRKLLMIQMII